ncbi:DUF397 domain-containing protein [Streptomyces sp. NPDC007904]|jgi:hypothetical protein|uniref:DUF397 domain-containing protein n=1 Tax=Streptomyces sp. NPDC007904 TaxID=3364787 RepID=UPI0036E09CDF
MNTEQPAWLDWFKSSHSSGEGGACVEIATDAAAIHVRDSKERGGPHLAFTRSAWSGSVAGLGRDRT